MNTSKQVNLMVGLLFLVVLGFGLYFVWEENVREEDATEKQVIDNAERGAFLFARNCRVCHGLTGRGSLENVNLPGLPLNLETNRDPSELNLIQARFADTIECGRVGTLMPPWHISQGGPLNDFQIQQLVTLITGATSDISPPAINNELVSLHAWEEAVEFAEEGDILLTPEGEKLQLIEPLTADGTTIVLNSVIGLAPDTFLRLDKPDVPPEEDEVVRILQVPATTELVSAVLEDDSSILVQNALAFPEGTVIAVEDELMRVVDVPEPQTLAFVRARAALAGSDLALSRIQVERGVDNTKAAYHKPATAVASADTRIVVERSAFDTEASEHAQGTQVFAGPIPPPEGPLTGEAGTPPCGQLAAGGGAAPSGPPAPTPSPGQPERPATAQAVSGEPEPPVNGVLETETRDNFFTNNNFGVALGQTVTIRVTDSGAAPHNLRVAGLDGEFDTSDDFAIAPSPNFLFPGQSGEGIFTLDQEATLVFRCDVHPTLMWGQITVTSQ